MTPDPRTRLGELDAETARAYARERVPNMAAARARARQRRECYRRLAAAQGSADGGETATEPATAREDR